jgi:type II secretory pathway component PulJ
MMVQHSKRFQHIQTAIFAMEHDGNRAATTRMPRGDHLREDVDGDGFLYSEELKTFATEMGFEGSDSEWSQDEVGPWGPTPF